MTKTSWYLRLAVALGCASGCARPDESAVTSAALTHAEGERPNSPLFAPDAQPFGFSLPTWAEVWQRWFYGIPEPINPVLHASASCDENQYAPVFFLANGNSGAPTCTVPFYKPIALTIASLTNDFPCPDPSFKPAPGETLFELLSAGAKRIQDDIVTVEGTLDGQSLGNLSRYRVASDDLFYFIGDKSLQSWDGCLTAAYQPAVVDAYFVMFKPLPPGPHVVTTNVVRKDGKSHTATVRFTVQ
jgi:hypothetical protein